MGPIIVTVIWFLLVILKQRRLGSAVFDFSLWVIMTGMHFLVVFGALEFTLFATDWIVYGGALISLAFVDAAALIRGIDRSETFQALEEKYTKLVRDSEALRERFIATMDILKDGLVYHDHDDRMFFTDPLHEILKLDESEMTYQTFLEKLHPDDVNAYDELYQKGLKSKKKFSGKLRIKVDHYYLWFEMSGLSVKIDKHPLTVMQLRPVDIRLFPKTDVDVLNQMYLEADADHVITTLHQNQTPYALIAMRLSNIPGINAKYGRDVGDMLMGEFLKKMRYHFIKEDQRIFRIQGILFLMILTDSRKIQFLLTALQEDSGLLQTTMQIGGVNESVYPYFGVVHVKSFEEHALDMKNQAIEALKESLNETTQENYFLKEF